MLGDGPQHQYLWFYGIKHLLGCTSWATKIGQAHACGWWENSHWSLSYNQLETNKTPHQPGGTCILCVNQVAHKTLRPGDNPLGLGRWCSICICSPNGFFLRVVSMYCLCFSNGPLMMYQQHVWRLTKLQQFECPWDAILMDIMKEIKSWQELSDHVIVLTDFNDEVTDLAIRHWAANIGLVEAITWLHPNLPPPAFQRGSWPIDSIFIWLVSSFKHILYFCVAVVQ